MGQYGMANGGYPGYGAAGQTGMYPGMQPYGGGAAAAAVPPKPAVSSPWSEHKTDEGVAYWYNSATGVSQVFIYLYIYLFMAFGQLLSVSSPFSFFSFDHSLM